MYKLEQIIKNKISDIKHMNIYNRMNLVKQKYTFTPEEINILELALSYQTFKVKYLGVNVFIFPFKSGDPRKVSKKLWLHFEIMYNTLKDNEIKHELFFDFIFKKFKNTNNIQSLSVWFIYSDQNINLYLISYQKESNINKTALNEAEKLILTTKICNNIVKDTMARRHCTELQFWSEVWIGNLISKFPIEFLKQNSLYKELYAKGSYSRFNFFPNPFK